MRLLNNALAETLHVVHRGGGDLDAWLSAIAAAFSGLADSASAGFVLLSFGDGGRDLAFEHAAFVGASFERVVSGFLGDPAGVDTEQIARYLFSRSMVETTLTAEHRAPDMIAKVRQQAALPDAVGLVLHPDCGLVATLSGLLSQPRALSRSERVMLTRLGLHLENALRLRLRPERIVAVLSPAGRLLYRDPDNAGPFASLSGLVSRLESARAAPAERLRIWRALYSGEYSLVEREETDGKRYYVLIENPPDARAGRALSAREVAVARRAARGLSGKMIAYALGVSPASVSSSLSAAATKLGLTSNDRAVRVLRALLSSDAPAQAQLTTAEREVLDLVLLGRTNREIGALRGRSEHTIANQVSSLLRKTGALSRRGLPGP